MSTHLHNHYEDLSNLNVARRELKKPLIETKKRKCLRCDKVFDSTGSGNRLCDRCKQDSHYIGMGYGDVDMVKTLNGMQFGCSSLTRSK